MRKKMSVDGYAILNRGTSDRVAIAQTLLTKTVRGKVQRLPFWGLFAIQDIPKYGFLGYYCGEFYEEDDPRLKRPPLSKSHYKFNGSGFTVIPHETDGIVSPLRYPMAMVNEPPPGTTANVCIIEWGKAGQAIPQLPPRDNVMVIAMHATRAIRAGEELYIHYGNGYDRRHYPKVNRQPAVGLPSHVSQYEVPPEEYPRAVMQRLNVRAPEDSFA